MSVSSVMELISDREEQEIANMIADDAVSRAIRNIFHEGKCCGANTIASREPSSESYYDACSSLPPLDPVYDKLLARQCRGEHISFHVPTQSVII
jgi:hypothetical protein